MLARVGLSHLPNLDSPPAYMGSLSTLARESEREANTKNAKNGQALTTTANLPHLCGKKLVLS
ncbi:hypothetical protein E2C01_042825 [Portunus trituberculatus]|uniref:Uncharacterized protein n=1 Tax=Portunus trituberculatus TaxID=210409 RepID=A0A5B7FUF6_PORTR|nr:hypothetical protein [Portunus trituberculatus]